MKKILFITLAGFVFASCNGKQSQEQVTESPAADSALVDKDSIQVVSPEEEKTEKQAVRDMTFEEAAGTYESLDEHMNSEARIVLMADGTATWVMIGSLNYTSYTYTIHGNTICMKMKGYETEEECYDYDEDTRTLKNEQGAVYYRQIEE